MVTRWVRSDDGYDLVLLSTGEVLAEIWFDELACGWRVGRKQPYDFFGSDFFFFESQARSKALELAETLA